MKDLRMEVRIARMKKGVKYTALFNVGPDFANSSLFSTISALAGKRVTIENIRTGGYDYRVDIVEYSLPVFPHELSEWREG